MKKHKGLGLVLLGIVIAHLPCMGAQKNMSFPDLMELRTPRSLTELLHVGLVNIENELVACFANSSQARQALLTISGEITGLLVIYDSIVDTANIHRVYSGDKEFLQSLIDRIDGMIATLERSVSLSIDESNLLHENVFAIRQLKVKL